MPLAYLWIAYAAQRITVVDPVVAACSILNGLALSAYERCHVGPPTLQVKLADRERKEGAEAPPFLAMYPTLSGPDIPVALARHLHRWSGVDVNDIIWPVGCKSQLVNDARAWQHEHQQKPDQITLPQPARLRQPAGGLQNRSGSAG